MTVNSNICPCCKGNGFIYLSIRPIKTEPCSDCKMTGEINYTDYKINKTEGFSNEQTRR